MEEILRIRPAQNSLKPIPFNGLLTNRILTALPGEDFARLLPYLEPVSLCCGAELFESGESTQSVYFPESAVLSHIHLLVDGNTVEAALIGKEGMVGLSEIFNSPRPLYWTQVTIAGTALRISTKIVKQNFALGGAMQRLLLGYASARIAQLSQRAVCNGRHSVEERLCCWLLMLHDRVGDNLLPLTHEQVSRHIGTRRAGVSVAATSLRDNGIISYTRGQIQIVDRQALEMAACECYQSLSQQNLVFAKS